MKYQKGLKNYSFYLILGLCLIFIGFLVYLISMREYNQFDWLWLFHSSNKNEIQIINQAESTIIPTPVSTYAKVTRIIDGDTIVIDTGQHVRYIGINTPETETSECFAKEAGDINEDLVLGKEVKLEKDVSETDKYGRLLRYVYVGQEMINDELVKGGSAKVDSIPPDLKYKDEFLQSEKYARQNNLGLWGKCY